jgi:hypothetical protein
MACRFLKDSERRKSRACDAPRDRTVSRCCLRTLDLSSVAPLDLDIGSADGVKWE